VEITAPPESSIALAVMGDETITRGSGNVFADLGYADAGGASQSSPPQEVAKHRRFAADARGYGYSSLCRPPLQEHRTGNDKWMKMDGQMAMRTSG